MHLTVALITVLAVWIRRDWRDWTRYHTTLLYIAFGNAMYNFICANYLLWELHPDFFPDHAVTEFVYTLITFPGCALMYLSRYPEGAGVMRQIRHILSWVLIFAGVELFFALTGRICYQYGWNLGWSVLFDSVMFPMLLLHHRRPLAAYLLSVPIAAVLIWYFKVPIDIPIEDR
ncbi:MAG TPA: CBO0543 family protein [Paenibacillus sp.]|uniref:CBO0543 family protein n=1 Tax=Paenibacillus sp. TaxID=58172 RepID=UPI0028D4B461|nr:CBO0543 family protein [Paenibacillus sp.]HUC93784.1 CBO0543 family protein [Paenibacillus sp.]